MEIAPGKNIAIKVPLHKWEDTIAFYRDKVALKVVKELANCATCWKSRGLMVSPTRRCPGMIFVATSARPIIASGSICKIRGCFSRRR